jgi:hypothetical protein
MQVELLREYGILTNYIQYNNEIRIWCSEAGGAEYCYFRLVIDGQEIRYNGNYSYSKIPQYGLKYHIYRLMVV